MCVQRWITNGTAALLVGAFSMPAAVADLSADVTFTAQEKSIIEEFYRERGREPGVESGKDAGRKPGANGKPPKSLPPGIAKNLERGKPLPPGIAKQVLPGELVDRLPRPPRGYERVIVDGKVLLVEVATQIIRDKLEDLILH